MMDSIEPTQSPGADGDPIVVMRGIRKEFPGVLALDDVSFELRRGEIHALAGENGSGKSTLVKILYGALTADAGTIEVDGEAVTFHMPAQAIQRGIVAISQELTLATTLTVTENVLMGRLPRKGRLVDWPRAHRIARDALEELGVHVDARKRVSELSIELQQEVEVARAVSARMRVLVLDEATSSLSETATERLLERLEQLRARGVAVVFISHRLRELYQCASRATVLRDGRLVGTAPLPETSERTLVGMMVGRDIEDLFGKRQIEKGEPALSVTGLTTADGTVADASFHVRAGEIVGVAGLVGSGKSELGLALAGALPFTGEVVVQGKAATLHSPRSAIRAGIGFIPEDRKKSAILPTRSVLHNLSAAWMRRLTTRLGILNVNEERRLGQETARRFRVRTPSVHVRIVQLSGGNQQKVVLGRWFALSPRVVVLSEPTRGIDVGAKSEVYGFIQDMAADGTAVLMISSELPELLGLADRILVMFRGRISGEFDAASTGEEEIAAVAFGAGEALEEAV
jgi:ABC-type sugar transport system ATPase subunit